MATRIIFLVVSLVFNGFVCLLGIKFGLNVWQQAQSRNYVETQGEINDSHVQVTRGSKGSYQYAPSITYTYRVDTTEHTSSRIRFGNSDYDSNSANAFVANYPPGEVRPVYYDPANPAISVLDQTLRGQDFFPLFLLTMGLSATLAWFFSVLKALLHDIHRSDAGGVPLIKDPGLRTRVRLPVIHPFYVALITAGFSSLIGMCVFQMVKIGSPSISFVIGTWLLCLFAGLTVFLSSYSDLRGGKSDLIIDSGSGTITLPPVHGRKQFKTVGFAEVQRIRAEERIVPGAKPNAPKHYQVRIMLANGETYIVASWGQQQRAWEFANWLKKQIGIS